MLILGLLWIATLTNAEYRGYYPTEPSQGRVWPMPQHQNDFDGYMIIPKQNFSFVAIEHNCGILKDAFQRYEALINSGSEKNFNKDEKLPSRLLSHLEENLSKGILMELIVNVTFPCETLPHLDMDEVYELQICPQDKTHGAILYSRSVWGALRGIETFAQLALENSISSKHLFINCTRILDYPRFPHRGLMLDTSRHYLPLKTLKESLDLMSMNKFNVFHWHITDDQSFPYVSKQFPELSKKGAYSDEHLYTHDDIDEVIEYARLRGIRVVVEFDTPGHTFSWGKGQPGLLTPCFDGNETNGRYGPIDPTKEKNYEFLGKLFNEITKRFPDYFMHLGADEVYFGCWESNPYINSFMESMNITGDYAKLENYYVQKLMEVLSKLSTKKQFIVWQEAFDNGVNLDKEVIVHVWKWANSPVFYNLEMDLVTNAGHRALLSACWYLNYISYGVDWQKYYDCDPLAFGGTPEQRKLVIGGEACMWGEYVDSTNLIPRTWPRASPVAERLWSPVSKTQNSSAAAPRLEEHRCRLWKRGYQVQPVGPGFCENLS